MRYRRELRLLVPITVLAVGACTASSLAQAQPAAGPGRSPAVGVYPPNATRVTAVVLNHAIYPAGTPPAGPAGPPGATLHALTLEIREARPARADVAMGPAAGVIETFSRDPLSPALVGRRIEAVLTLTGTTQARRWFVSDIRTLE